MTLRSRLDALTAEQHALVEGYHRNAQAIEEARLAVGEQQARAVRRDADSLTAREAEFRVFSQWNEDGIIQWLIAKLGLTTGRFIEFGVESYAESNTRFLLTHNNWRGLILDGGASHIEFVQSRELIWRYDLTAVTSFVDRDNINDLFRTNGFKGEIELLSIDIDGNDYWVWEAIDAVTPKIVVAEYNSTFGAEHAVTVPYDDAFDHNTAHYSRLYFGASLAAMERLADAKGYALVATESHGSNAFFVRRDVMGALPPLSVAAGWVESRFRSSRDTGGQLTFVSDHRDRLRLMRELPLVDVTSGEPVTIAELYGV
ncbi:MAG: hypothetical protein QOF21_3013 [Actinomycetota bacterium]|jgi:hypothetical protein